MISHNVRGFLKLFEANGHTGMALTAWESHLVFDWFYGQVVPQNILANCFRNPQTKLLEGNVFTDVCR